MQKTSLPFILLVVTAASNKIKDNYDKSRVRIEFSYSHCRTWLFRETKWLGSQKNQAFDHNYAIFVSYSTTSKSKSLQIQLHMEFNCSLFKWHKLLLFSPLVLERNSINSVHLTHDYQNVTLWSNGVCVWTPSILMYTCYWEEIASCTFKVIRLFWTNRSKLKTLASATGGKFLGVSKWCFLLWEGDKHGPTRPRERKTKTI